MRKMAGEAQLLAGRRTDLAFFLPGLLAETYGKTCRGVQARTQWRCTGARHHFSMPSQGVTIGCGCGCGQGAASPGKEAVCPPASAVPQPLTARPCKGQISFSIGLISHNVPMDQHLLSFPRKHGQNHVWALRYNPTRTVASMEIFIACWEISLWFSLTLLFTFTLKYPGL